MNTGGNYLQVPNRIAEANLPRGERTRTRFFNTDAFVRPPLYQLGNAGRRILIGPGTSNLDLSFVKQFTITESKSLQFRAEMFNATNHPNWGAPGYDTRNRGLRYCVVEQQPAATDADRFEAAVLKTRSRHGGFGYNRSTREVRMHRRNFIRSTAIGAALVRGLADTTDHPVPVRNPRSTSGDPVEPEWSRRLTLTVGPENADLAGSTEKVVQAAVDSIARWGGGTVKVLPGTYHFRNAVYLQSNIRILGSGLDSVITKQPSVAAKLADDSDWFDQEITFADASGLEIGDGVCLRVKNISTSGTEVIKRTLVARSGNRFKLDRALRQNVWLMGEPQVETLFPLFSGENISGVAIENIALDGNKANNGNLDGNYAGCIWLQDCNRITMRKVTARNYNGDGISWQICHDVLVEDCFSHDHTGLGLHPGSGSQRSIIRRNRMSGNDQGLFFCWGVKWALAEKNYIENSRKYGISIGHHDTDNLVRDNDVRGSGQRRNPVPRGTRGGVSGQSEPDRKQPHLRRRSGRGSRHRCAGPDGVDCHRRE